MLIIKRLRGSVNAPVSKLKIKILEYMLFILFTKMFPPYRK